MKVSPWSFDELPFQRLFREYVKGEVTLDPFFKHRDLYNPSAVREAVTASFRVNRETLVEELTQFNKELGAPAETLESIALLNDPKTGVVVTGQQLNILGGPLMIGYKALTAIQMAEKYTKILGSPVIPVFWLADEDHDLLETLDVALPKTMPGDDPTVVSFTLDIADERRPVGSVNLPDSISELLSACQREVGDALHTQAVLPSVRESYSPGASFLQAFGSLLLKWFGSMGLVLVSARIPALKSAAAPIMAHSVSSSQEIFNLLNETTESIKSIGYSQQAAFQTSHLFKLHPEADGQRIKITESNGIWTLPGDERIDSESLSKEIHSNPEVFSPGVFLRLMVQSHLLPVFGIVAGPAEVAYIGQASALFAHFGLEMPIIIPRLSVTVATKRSSRWLNALPLTFPDYLVTWQDLQHRLIRTLDTVGVEKTIKKWIEELRTLEKHRQGMIEAVDPTLLAHSARLLSGMENNLEHLGKKLNRSIRRREAHMFRRASSLQAMLYPGGSLQERKLSTFALMCEVGPDLWERLKTALNEAPFDCHHLVEME